MRVAVCLCLVLALSAVDASRSGRGIKLGGSSRRGGGATRRGGSTTKHKPPASAPKPNTKNTDIFINNERASGGNTHYRGDPFQRPSVPQQPKPPVQTNGPIGFEHYGGNSQQGSRPLGFDKVNSDVQHSPGNSRVPSAPPYPGTNNGAPPPYSGSYPGNGYGGTGDHPPAYPGRPVNAPPSYTANNPYSGQANPPHQYPGNNYPSNNFPVNNYPGQHSYSGQTYPGSQNFGFGNNYPQHNQFGGSFPAGGSSYPSNTGFFPGYGSNSFGNNYPHTTSYQGNSFGGSPFGNAGQHNNPYYNPQNFGYSSNPGYFGSQSGYPGQYNNYQKKSRFGGLPIPIPIPIPIPFGGGGFGGLGGYGGLGGFGGNGYSYHHRLLDTFVKNQTKVPDGNSTSVFILNNSTVTPCTSDHFVYDLLKVSVVSCTAEVCTAIKVYTTTNISNVVSVHSAGVTLCLENNATFSYYGDNITPTVSGLQQENNTVCRDVPNNSTKKNETVKSEEVTTVPSTGSDPTTTEVPTTTMPDLSNSTRVCETVNCSRVEMCFPAIEIVDKCSMTENCPFRRTGYKPCVTIKMCRSPSAPVSTFATLNTTISKIDEFNNHNDVYDAANLTLISYHRPVISFNCTGVATPGCPAGPALVNASQPTTKAPSP